MIHELNLEPDIFEHLNSWLKDNFLDYERDKVVDCIKRGLEECPDAIESAMSWLDMAILGGLND